MFRESDGEDDLHRTAQYLARNVILYTHYVGEVSRIVDEHFSKALDQTTYTEQKGKRNILILVVGWTTWPSFFSILKEF